MPLALLGPIVDALGTEGILASALGRSIAPFTADADGYDKIQLNWTAPMSGSGSGYRITRSRSGFPRTYDDGEQITVVETPDWNENSGYTVENLPGGWHYFSFFIKRTGAWLRVATVDCLLPYDYSTAERLWDVIPAHYRFVHSDTAFPSQANIRINPGFFGGEAQALPNLLLWNFITLFGWGFDLLRTQAEGVLTGYDVDSMHISRLANVARQFGHELEQAVPAHANRTMVRNLAVLYRKRGTIEGIKDLLTMTSGWEVDVVTGPNLMLSEEQANFVNPDYQIWDANKQYTSGTIVKHGTFTFKALVTSRGLLQAPPATAVSNTWWEYLAYPRKDSTANRADTGDVSTWQVLLDTVPTPGNTKVGVGSLEPFDSNDFTGNSLQVYTTTAATTLEVTSVPRRDIGQPLITPTPLNFPLENAIALPNTVEWEAGVTYQVGTQVSYLSALYLAKTQTDDLPTVTTSWTRIGFDTRPRLILSTYAHGPFAGTGGTGGKVITPVIEEYGAGGAFIRKVIAAPSTYTGGVFFDPFVDDNVAIITGTVAPLGGTWTSDGVGTWTITRDEALGGYVTIPASGASYRRPTTVTSVDRRVAVTFTHDPGTVRLIGIMFRRADANNYWISTQTGLFKVVAGAAPANPASGALTWSKFQPGERMMVDFAGSTISVYRSGTLLGTATDSFNSGVNLHGLGTRA